ncbi:MAG: class I SAM-dependent methyltransferase [Rhodospirillaceae bacterium]|nr:MAG: class I SAM-dependent methyltransferase [Rhodospirillaceae bacterium]
MDYDAAALQKFSDSLAGNPPAQLDAATLQTLIECLRAENIKNFGAMESAHLFLVRTLSSLPDLGFATLEGREPPVRELLLTYLSFNMEMDEALEYQLTRMRKTLLSDVLAGNDAGEFGVDLLSSLAIFAFGKEFVLSETPEETQALQKISIYNGAAHVAMIACYRALHRLHQPSWLLDTEQTTARFARMLTIQLAEPLEELRLRTEIRSLSPITEATSVNVRQMYEENPYPRWTKRPVRRAVPQGKDVNILVAGCGSGQHPIGLALSQPGCRIVGLDLSLASLAYALRKSREYGVTNLELVQGDILALESSGLRFDFISCVGVLHHMAEPVKGLRALKAVLADNGRIDLGLYTESGRQAVVHAIAVRKQLGVPATADGIRTLRRYILGLPANAPARNVTRFADFYTMSGCRDLIFHVQEHRYELPSIDKLLKDAGMALKRFQVPSTLAARFRAEVPDGDESNLLDWAKFEAANPAAFGSMYNLSVIKPAA